MAEYFGATNFLALWTSATLTVPMILKFAGFSGREVSFWYGD